MDVGTFLRLYLQPFSSKCCSRIWCKTSDACAEYISFIGMFYDFLYPPTSESAMSCTLLLGLLLQAPTLESMPTGLEWMVWASVLVPAVLLVVIIYIGTKKTV